MDFILYRIAYFLLWVITRFPFSWLYALSAICYPMIYYVIPYRKSIVLKNLRNSFPDWDEKKVKDTARKFYRHFCNSMVESGGLHFMEEKEILKRMKYKNPELVNELFSKGKSIVLMMAHYGNWELTLTCPRFVNHEVVAIYKPLSNKYFDGFSRRSRQRFGVTTVPMDKILRYLSEAGKQGKKTMTYFISDQRPHWSQINHWTVFFNQETPVFLGAEKIARKYNMAVVYLKIVPVSKGHYEAEFILLKEEAVNAPEFEITNLYLRTLENNIREAPEYWLWTHNRWKYDKKNYSSK
jgi:Kdo2-lipid IVA lauroyltransferase/acyltransferase